MAASSTFTNFIQALNVMNASLEANRDSWSFKSLFQACSSNLEGKGLVVSVYTDDPERPIDSFTIRFANGTFVLVARGGRESETVWNVSEDCLWEIAHHPHKYVENPEMLSLDWLKECVGLGRDTTPSRP